MVPSPRLLAQRPAPSRRWDVSDISGVRDGPRGALRSVADIAVYSLLCCTAPEARRLSVRFCFLFGSCHATKWRPGAEEEWKLPFQRGF